MTRFLAYVRGTFARTRLKVWGCLRVRTQSHLAVTHMKVVAAVGGLLGAARLVPRIDWEETCD